MNQTVDIERLRDLRSQLLREAENIGKSRKATQQEAYKYIEDIRRKYSQSYVQQSVDEAQRALKAYCDSVREQEEAIYKKVDVLKTLINMYEVERYREKRAIEQSFGIMANGMRNNRSTFMSSLDRWKQEGIGWLSKGREELGKVLVDLFQQNIETLMQSLYKNGIGKISGSKLEEMKVNLQRYYETVSQTEVPIDRVSMNLYNQLAEDLRELQVEEADIIELLKLPAEEGIKTLELLFILKGHEHQLEKESIEEELGGKAIKQMIVKAIGEEIGTKNIADVLWVMDDNEKEALYDELGEKGITDIEEIVVDEKENILKIRCSGNAYEITLEEAGDKRMSENKSVEELSQAYNDEHWNKNYTTLGNVVYSDDNRQRTMAFYSEGKALDFSIYKINPLSGEAEYLDMNVLDGEVGVISWDGKYRDGSFDGDLLSAESKLGLSVPKKKGGVYGKASVVDLSGEVYIPLPFTDKRLLLGGGVDFITIGGGIEADFSKGARVKAGYHPGIIGIDILLGIK